MTSAGAVQGVDPVPDTVGHGVPNAALRRKQLKSIGDIGRSVPETDLAFFAVAAVAVVFAGISKGGFGSGASFAAAPMLALILEPRQALALLLPLLLVMDFAALPPWWRRWHWPAARAMIAGAVPGVLLGSVFWRIAPPDLLRGLIGAVALAFVAYQAAAARGWLRPARAALSDRAGIAFGVAAGFTSFVSHAGGPLAAVYLLSRGIGKTQYQATTVLVFLVINLMKLPAYAAPVSYTHLTLPTIYSV